VEHISETLNIRDFQSNSLSKRKQIASYTLSDIPLENIKARDSVTTSQDEPLPDSDSLAKTGRKKYEEGNIDLAEELLLEALRADPSNLEALVTLGMIYYDADKKEEFMKICSDVISLQADNVEVYQSIEHFLIEKSNMPLAEEIIKAGIAYNPSNPDFLYLYGDFMMMTDRYEEATFVYESALGLDYTDPTAYQKLAEIASSKGLNDVAASLMETASQFSTKSGSP
jgi:tetratricopeptide (TPR) repeat protein